MYKPTAPPTEEYPCTDFVIINLQLIEQVWSQKETLTKHTARYLKPRLSAQTVCFQGSSVAWTGEYVQVKFRDVPDIRFRLARYPAIFCYPVSDGLLGLTINFRTIQFRIRPKYCLSPDSATG